MKVLLDRVLGMAVVDAVVLRNSAMVTAEYDHRHKPF
jgi:hypothetical protein